MSVYRTPRGGGGGLPGAPDPPRSSSPLGLGPGPGSGLKQPPPSGPDVSERENDDPLLSSAKKLRGINSTYVISACKASGGAPLAPNPAARLTLQRRVTRHKEESPLPGREGGESSASQMEPRLRLQRRAGAGSVGRRATAEADSSVGGGPATARADSGEVWTTARGDSVGGQATTRADSVGRQGTAGADSVVRQTAARADSVDVWTTARADSVARQTAARADSVGGQATTRADSVARQTAARADSVARQTAARADSVGRQTAAGADSVARQTAVGADPVGRQTAARADPVGIRTAAPADPVGRQTAAGADSVARQTAVGADSVARQTAARADSVARQTAARADPVGIRTAAPADPVGRQTAAGADSETQSVGGAAAGGGAPRDAGGSVRIADHGRNSRAASPASSAEDGDPGPAAGEDDGGSFSALVGARGGGGAHGHFTHSTPIRPRREAEGARPGPRSTKPGHSPWDARVGAGSLRPRGLGKDVSKRTSASDSSGAGTPGRRTAEPTWTPRRGTPRPRPQGAATPTPRRGTPSSQGQQKPKRTLFANTREGCHEQTLPPTEEAAASAQSAPAPRDPPDVESSQVTVAVRVRPFSKRERDEGAAQVVFLDGAHIAVRPPDLRQEYRFLYDVALWSFDPSHPRHAGQAAVYEALAAPLLARALQGYNACLLAYGQTGSGKSYTMMGFGEEPGIIPRFCEDLFAQVAKNQSQEVRFHLEMSFFEVYNEKIHDLLGGGAASGQGKQPLRVREHPVSGPYVEGLAVNAVGSYSDIQGWLQLGSKQRATAATGMNDKSSRSHSVLTLLMTRTQTELVDGEQHDHAVTSRISLVDLAGSERQGPAGTSGQLLREGVSINKSLLTLGKVISALAELGGRRGAFVPYRESVLTWLLKESLGGNSRTAMVATVSPAAGSLEETLSTLRYARQARSIVNVARVNEDTSAQLIRELKAEIEKLKAAQRSRHNVDPERYRLCRQEITTLRMRLHEQERAMAAMQRAWKEKFEQAEKRKHLEMEELQRAGVTFQGDGRLPSLVSLSEDPQLSEALLYVLREGRTAVGRRRPGPGPGPDIQLAGALVADRHCIISNAGGTVTIAPVGEARTYVNGEPVLGPTELHHGDRVVLGGDHFFRFHHPAEARRRQSEPGGGAPAGEGPKDFEFARDEWLAAQRAQLEAEAREAQLRARQEMLRAVQVAKEVAEQELSCQRAAFEGRIEALQAELKEESQQKQLREVSSREADRRIEELERAKQRLEQEVQAHRRRLELQRLAAQQALEDHSVRHTRILEALEAEKQKIAREVQALQRGRDGGPPGASSWGSLKLSLMIQEANALCGRGQRQYVFSRHEAPHGGGGRGPRVRVRNLQLGVATLWSREKFESKLAAMKEPDESACRWEDLFCDPEDQWEPDLPDAPAAPLSRRRSRSLAKHRGVSGYLHGVQAHAVPRLPSCGSSGSGETPGSAGCALPGICRELVGEALAALGQSGEAGTAADGLVDGLGRVHGGLLALSRAHAAQGEDGPGDLLSADPEAQAWAVRVACALGQLAALAPLWPPGEAAPGAPAARLGEELRRELGALGGCVQALLQACASDVPAVVSAAQQSAARAVHRAAARVGQLAVLSGSRLRLLDPGACGGADVQEDLADALWDGVGEGLRLLLDSGLERAGELRRQLSGQPPQSEAAQQLSAKAAALAGGLEAVLAAWRAEEPRGRGALREAAARAPGTWELMRHVEQAVGAALAALGGRSGGSDGGALRPCVERLCELAGDLGAGGCARSLGELAAAAKALLLCLEGPRGPRPPDGGEGLGPPGPSRTGPTVGRGDPRRGHALPSRPRSSGGRPPGGTQGV